MASNYFGDIFRITTYGESHGHGVGVVIDGCPAGVPLHEEMINIALKRRAPGQNVSVSPRAEADLVEIQSGVFQAKTTGHPIALFIRNQNFDSSKYEPVKDILKPGHANYTYLEKYGVYDYRGGGRASARETAARVAAGAVAKSLLRLYDIDVIATLTQVGILEVDINSLSFSAIQKNTIGSNIFCAQPCFQSKIEKYIAEVKAQGDSLGGIVTFLTEGVMPGLGDPIYDKLEAKMAAALMSIPASKGFEIGHGFAAASMLGSEHNDGYTDNKTLRTNHCGGILAGISTGTPIRGRVAFKPTSSIQKQQQSSDLNGAATAYVLPKGSKHDPCVAIRAVPVVEAMVSLVLADALLKQATVRLSVSHAVD